MPGEISAIAKAISEGFKVLGQWQKDRHVRRLMTAIDNAEKYIRINTGDLYSDKSESYRKKMMSKYKYRFYKYNQG